MQTDELDKVVYLMADLFKASLTEAGNKNFTEFKYELCVKLKLHTKEKYTRREYCYIALATWHYLGYGSKKDTFYVLYIRDLGEVPKETWRDIGQRVRPDCGLRKVEMVDGVWKSNRPIFADPPKWLQTDGTWTNGHNYPTMTDGSHKQGVHMKAFEVKEFIYGVDAATVTETQLIAALHKVGAEIAALEPLKGSKRIQELMNELDDQRNSIVAVLDNKR